MVLKLKAPRTANGYPVQLKMDTTARTFSVGCCLFLGGYALNKKSDLREIIAELLKDGYKEI